MADVTEPLRPRGGLGLDPLMVVANGHGVNGLNTVSGPLVLKRFRIRPVSMADKKLPFHVVFASGEDPQYPASELNVHSSKVPCLVAISLNRV
jgi:hypothetical protein